MELKRLSITIQRLPSYNYRLALVSRAPRQILLGQFEVTAEELDLMDFNDLSTIWAAHIILPENIDE
jgi:hypothetical protein